MPFILVISEGEMEKLEHYADPQYCSGGFQNLCRKLVRRVVASKDGIDDAMKRLNEQKGLFSEPPEEPCQ